MILSSYQKSANPSRSRRKNPSRNEKLSDTTNKNQLCRRLADTRDLKSLSGDRVRVRPPSAASKSLELFVDSNNFGISLCVPFSGNAGGTRGFLRKKNLSCTTKIHGITWYIAERSKLSFCLLCSSLCTTLPHPAFQRLIKPAQAEREQKYGQGPDHGLHCKAKLVRSPLHIPDQYLMNQKAVRGELCQPQKRLCG